MEATDTVVRKGVVDGFTVFSSLNRIAWKRQIQLYARE